MKKEYLFGRKHFQKWSKCHRTFSIDVKNASDSLRRLFDHGFLVDAAVVWGGHEFKGHELSIVSRTYCEYYEIDNPPKGLRCVRLPKEVMGKDDEGTAIATVITEPSTFADAVVNMCLHLPAWLLPCLLSKSMVECYHIAIQATDTYAKARIVPF